LVFSHDSVSLEFLVYFPHSLVDLKAVQGEAERKACRTEMKAARREPLVFFSYRSTICPNSKKKEVPSVLQVVFDQHYTVGKQKFDRCRSELRSATWSVKHKFATVPSSPSISLLTRQQQLTPTTMMIRRCVTADLVDIYLQFSF
jgi:hypothetical protein